MSAQWRSDYSRQMSNAQVSFRQVDADGLIMAALDGELDVDSADTVRDSLAEAARRPECRFLQVDVSRLVFIDSYAMGALVSARNTALGAGVTLTLTNPSPPVCKAIDVTGLSDVFGLPAADRTPGDRTPDDRTPPQANPRGKGEPTP
jgi:anti-sigma B factor antagonist